jgi:hypothetical protein
MRCNRAQPDGHVNRAGAHNRARLSAAFVREFYSMSALAPAVAEIQGLYGPFSFSEKLLQKIWLRGEFDRVTARTLGGQGVKILHPGKWNLLGGPDFKGARMRLGDGPEITGDVELHLRAADWDAHAHARDPAYDGVVLHVVLFPPEGPAVTRGARGDLPVLALLPLLHHDLEEFAAEDAVASLAGRVGARLPEELAALSMAEVELLLKQHAAKRWQQKVRYARLRLDRLSWEQACHHAALEILGYRFNRAPMLQVALRWPLAEWVREGPLAEEVFAAIREDGGWSVQGVRPANHPRTRLRQYAAWVRARPDWPERLRGSGGRLPRLNRDNSTREERRNHEVTGVRARILTEICGDALRGTRLDNLVCDGLLPLLAAEGGAGNERFEGMWVHWFPGDLPPLVTRGLRELGVFSGSARPACHGAAQGMLGWLWEREGRR